MAGLLGISSYANFDVWLVFGMCTALWTKFMCTLCQLLKHSCKDPNTTFKYTIAKI